jgi:hypothetical protein
MFSLYLDTKVYQVKPVNFAEFTLQDHEEYLCVF